MRALPIKSVTRLAEQMNRHSDRIKELEKGIEMRKREIKSHEETIKHFKKRIEELKKELSGQGDLF